MLDHLSLRLRIFLFFAFLAVSCSLLVIGALTLGYARLAGPEALPGFILAGVVAVFAIFAVTTCIWILFDENVAKPVDRLAVELRARAHAEIAAELSDQSARYLGDLAPAAIAVTEGLSKIRKAVAEASARATRDLARQKAYLETVLAELPEGVLICSAEHRISGYNLHAARMMLNREAIGLGRPVSALLRLAPIREAYARLLTSDRRAGANLLVMTQSGARLLEARLRLLRLPDCEDDRPGYLLSLNDVSADLAAQKSRDALLDQVLQGAARAVAEEDLESLKALHAQVAARRAVSDPHWGPKEIMAAADLGHAVQSRLARKGVEIELDFDQVRVRCDGFALSRLLERLVLECSAHGAAEVRLSGRAIENGRLALSLSSDCEPSAWDEWLKTPLAPGVEGFTGHDVLQAHGASLEEGELAPGRFVLRLSLPCGAEEEPSTAGEVVYDLQFLKRGPSSPLPERRLTELSYVVFDTETTGLDPERDEICQIAAQRIVNGRAVPQERFDMLVNPGRPIPQSATDIHRISNEMVEAAPGVTDAVARFHTFAEGAILVAHNAPFDMAFLRRREDELNLCFDQPIVDTVLCSSILYGQTATHTLDRLCERLQITIPDEARHTAIGDAIATAEALNCMLPMLEAKGIATLGQLVAEFNLHRRLIKNLN